MHYIRLLKPLSIHVVSDNTYAKVPKQFPANEREPWLEATFKTLLTVTTDLGESFYPYDLSLTIRLEPNPSKTLHSSQIDTSSDESAPKSKRRKTRPPHCRQPCTEFTVGWKARMRQLAISIPVPKETSLNDTKFTLLFSPSVNRHGHVAKNGKITMPPVLSLCVEREELPDGEFSSRYFRMIPLVDEEGRRQLDAASNHLYIEESPPSRSTSIASHVWDAGVALASSLPHLLEFRSTEDDRQSGSALLGLSKIFLRTLDSRADGEEAFNVIELGAGCAPLSASLARTVSARSLSSLGSLPVEGAKVKNIHLTLTDLPEAEEVAQSNVELARNAGLNLEEQTHNELSGMSVASNFVALKWEEVVSSPDDGSGSTRLPDRLKHRRWDLIMASDVTYNPASSPALVRTIAALWDSSMYTSCNLEKKGDVEGLPVLIALKVRHEDEDVFWKEMTDASFHIEERLRIWCPFVEGKTGCKETGEWVEVVVFGRSAALLNAREANR